MSAEKKLNNGKRRSADRIAAITIAGFKSICEEQKIEIRPLTILAGANSSGKSSAIQPLLLLKQTLETRQDPGAIFLEGDNVRFTSADQLLCKAAAKPGDKFKIGIEFLNFREYILTFARNRGKGLAGFRIEEQVLRLEDSRIAFHEGMTHSELVAHLPKEMISMHSQASKQLKVDLEFIVVRHRCFLDIAFRHKNSISPPLAIMLPLVLPDIARIIHLPGLRGIPERTYKLS